MSVVVNVDVRWGSGRLVHVRCLGLSLLAERDRDISVTSGAPLDDDAVASVGSFHDYLKKVTRTAPDGGTVKVVGFEPEIFKILELLEIEGPPPDPITVTLDQQ
jgi:hypothetical protein